MARLHSALAHTRPKGNVTGKFKYFITVFFTSLPSFKLVIPSSKNLFVTFDNVNVLFSSCNTTWTFLVKLGFSKKKLYLH